MTNIKKRLSAERRFKFYGQLGVFLSLLFVTLLMLKIFTTGSGAFFRTTIEADVFFDPNFMQVDKNSSDKEISRASFEALADSVVNNNFKDLNEDQFIKVREMFTRRFDYQLRDYFLDNKDDYKKTVKLKITASSDLDQIVKGNYPRNVPEEQRKINDYQLSILDELNKQERIGSTFNFWFFTNGDSRDPETAGIWGAIMGSFYALMVCLAFAFPIGLFASVYLEEYTKPGKITD